MGGVVRLVKSMRRGSTPLPVMDFKDSAGVSAPQDLQDAGRRGMSAIVTGKPIENEVEAPPETEETLLKKKETLLKKKKKGRYSTLLTGGKGVTGGVDIEKKSLLGS